MLAYCSEIRYGPNWFSLLSLDTNPGSWKLDHQGLERDAIYATGGIARCDRIRRDKPPEARIVIMGIIAQPGAVEQAGDQGWYLVPINIALTCKRLLLYNQTNMKRA
jgi:hypothetical protein